MRTRLGLLYGILVALLLVMGVWWVYFLSQESRIHAQYQQQKLANDRLHATFLIQSDPRVAAEPERWLGESFPHLLFRGTAHGTEVVIDPVVMREIESKARATRNMFLYEGIFFLALLVAGSTILILSLRTEARFKQARELFLAGATHEFKTPLASLRLYTETLGREGLPVEETAGIRQRMVQDISRLEELVNQVLSLSAGDTFSQGPRLQLDLAEECNLVLNDIRRFTNERKAQVILEEAEGCFIRGHRLILSLALRNLVLNAVKHSPAPVQVRVRVEQGKKWHQLIIQDDGPGIPRRLQSKVFECFFTGDRDGQRSGSGGLGLFLVKRNIEKLGGRITLSSEEGHGCVFTVRLPAHSPDS
ncbi:MAG: HAMP domain-containing histidine kinase [Gemmatimonadales bacterium]|nr:HAMP domain-containing histidine kinase [Gemmatimonadales bacterium]